MNQLKVKSQPIRKHSSKRLIYACLEDVFFFDPMYSSYSEGDNDEDYIKLQASYNKQSATQATNPEETKELAHLELDERSNSCASLSSTSDVHSDNNQLGDQPMIAKLLPYLGTLKMEKSRQEEEQKHII